MKEIKENLWLLIPLTLVLFLFCLALYHKKYHCVEVQYYDVCQKCILWETKTNGRHGKYKRSWQECLEYKSYNCINTYDSCNCNN